MSKIIKISENTEINKQFNSPTIVHDYSNKKRKINDTIFDSNKAIELSRSILSNINENELKEINSIDLIDKKNYLIINTKTNNKIIGQFIKTFFELSELLFITKDFNMIIKSNDVYKTTRSNKPIDIIRNNLLKKLESHNEKNFKIYSLSNEIELAYLVSDFFD